VKHLSIDEAARIMGMKAHREVLEVVLTGAGNVVRTHDGIWTLIDVDGRPRGAVPAPARRSGGVLVEVDSEPEVVDPEAVPDGSVDVVLTWVGGDKGRAGRALAVENGRPAPRSTLVVALEKLRG